MDLTTVIVNWNAGELLRQCLGSVKPARNGLMVQVIVVDNASRDGSGEMVQREVPDFEVINSGANLGFARGSNLARLFLRSDLILFPNPDMILMENLLVSTVQFMRHHPDVGASGSKMLYPDRTVQEQGIQWHLKHWRAFVELLLVTQKTHKRMSGWSPYLNPAQSGYGR